MGCVDEKLEQLRILQSNHRFDCLVAIPWAAIICILFGGAVDALGTHPYGALLSWLGLITLWSGVSYIGSIRLSKLIRARKVKPVELWFTVIYGVNGLVWGSLVWFTWEIGNLPNNLFFGFIILILTSSYLVQQTPFLPAYFAGLLFSHGQYWLCLLQNNDDLAIAMTVGLPAVLAWLSYAGVLANRTLHTNIKLRFEETALKRQLEAVSERTQKALEVADAANRAKSDFLATVSHELRTPLNAISGFSQMLRQRVYGPLNERQDEYVGHIESSSKLLEKIIGDILNLNQVDSGQHDIALEQLDVSQMANHVGLMIQHSEPAKAGRLKIVGGADSIPVFADRDRVKEILINLISNALKYSAASDPVTLGWTSEPPFTVFRVTDHGPGMSAEDAERARKPFIRLSNPMTTSVGGVGLGLSIVDRLVDLHGGRLVIESTPGKGTCVKVYLPQHPPTALAS